MWRTILLGKLGVSIAASIGVGILCLRQQPQDAGWMEIWQWRGLGVFFLVLAVAQVAAIYFMLRRKKLD